MNKKPKPTHRRGEPAVCLSISEAAEELGHTRETIARRIARANLEPAGVRRGYAVYRLRDLLAIERTYGLGEQDPDSMPPFERQAHFKAESERQRVNANRARLLQADDAHGEWSRVVREIDAHLELLPAAIAAVTDSAAALERVEERVADLRKRLRAERPAQANDGD